jgi:L-proline 3-hydroxylase, C-terminal/Aspartyl/Asparaginyl beta-hydroxylase
MTAREARSAVLHARRIGALPLDSDALRRDVETVLALGARPCADGVGEWTFVHLWYGDAAERRDADDGVRRSVPYLDRVVGETFTAERIVMVRAFVARAGGYVRPHRDWTGTAAAFTRLHVPLQTNGDCVNSEDDAVYHMSAGEIWFLDGGRAHSGACFSPVPRVHLVVDFVPGIPLRRLFREPAAYRPARRTALVARAPLAGDDVAAIHALGALASGASFERVADLLGMLHFERAVSCAAAYDWLDEIARRSGDASLAARSAERRRSYLGAPLAG